LNKDYSSVISNDDDRLRWHITDISGIIALGVAVRWWRCSSIAALSTC